MAVMLLSHELHDFFALFTAPSSFHISECALLYLVVFGTVVFVLRQD